YFMSAHHCTQDNSGAFDSMTVYWFYQRAGCSGAVPALSSCPRTDIATYVASHLPTDMTLMMLEGTVPRNLWWAANDTSPFAPPSVVGIHHPRGTQKRISFALAHDGAGCAETGLSQGFYVDYSQGTTEPGSSGSPLFFTNGAFVGVCSCGPPGGQCPGDGP